MCRTVRGSYAVLGQQETLFQDSQVAHKQCLRLLRLLQRRTVGASGARGSPELLLKPSHLCRQCLAARLCRGTRSSCCRAGLDCCRQCGLCVCNTLREAGHLILQPAPHHLSWGEATGASANVSKLVQTHTHTHAQRHTAATHQRIGWMPALPPAWKLGVQHAWLLAGLPPALWLKSHR